MVTANEQRVPFGEIGRRMWVRRGLSALLLIAGVTGIVFDWRTPRVWLVLNLVYLVAGALLWSRFWQAGMWCFYAALGSFWLAKGLADHQLHSVVMGVVMLGAVAWGLVEILRERAQRTDNQPLKTNNQP